MRGKLDSGPGARPNLAGPAKARSATARHHLALLYRAHRPADAEAQWRAALQLKPESMSAWLGLGELYLVAGRWPELEEVVTRLAAVPGGALEATVLRARGHLAGKELAEAQDWSPCVWPGNSPVERGASRDAFALTSRRGAARDRRRAR